MRNNVKRKGQPPEKEPAFGGFFFRGLSALL